MFILVRWWDVGIQHACLQHNIACEACVRVIVMCARSYIHQTIDRKQLKLCSVSGSMIVTF